jgi:hypothetical protein
MLLRQQITTGTATSTGFRITLLALLVVKSSPAAGIDGVMDGAYGLLRRSTCCGRLLPSATRLLLVADDDGAAGADGIDDDPSFHLDLNGAPQQR